MKKLLYLVFFLLMFIYFGQNKNANAAGSIQSVTFHSTSTVATRQPVSIPFQYIYSGDYFTSATIISSHFPDGMKLSSIEYGKNGFNTVYYYGTPTKAGNYKITLLITDNNGALLTQTFSFIVTDEPKLQVISADLSDGYVGEKYLGNVIIRYIGIDNHLTVGATNLPEGIEISPPVIKAEPLPLISQGTMTVNLAGTPTKAGNYLMTLDIQNYDLADNRDQIIRSFPINIINRPQINTTTLIQATANNPENTEKNTTSIKQSINIDQALTNRLKGRILLQTESHGEAWYVNPKTGKRYYMANGVEAFKAMRNFGVGITNKNLEAIKKSTVIAKKYSGTIFLQTESHGEAFYIDFNGNHHYLKDGLAAYNIMRSLGLGISNNNLEKIELGQ